MSMMLFAVLAAGCGGGEDQAGGKAATQKFINIATGALPVLIIRSAALLLLF